MSNYNFNKRDRDAAYRQEIAEACERMTEYDLQRVAERDRIREIQRNCDHAPINTKIEYDGDYVHEGKECRMVMIKIACTRCAKVLGYATEYIM